MYKIEELTFELPDLPFAHNALEPYMDEETMKIHHGKHHKAYADKFRGVVEKFPELLQRKALSMIQDLNSVPEDIRKGVKNFGGGHINHSFFWTILGKGSPLKEEMEVVKAIKDAFGSQKDFVELFTNASNTFFGSGWTWLVVNKEGMLKIVNTANQDSPYSNGQKPVLCLDLWEHSYYLRYRNERNKYVDAFFNIINWEQVNEYYKTAVKKK